MLASPIRKRKEYLVDRTFQIRFASRLLLAVFLIASISACFSSVLLWKGLYQPEEGVQTSLATALIAVSATLLVELLLAIPIIVVFSVRQTHRILGPMNRIRQALAAIGRGEFPQRIRLRQGDALEDLAEAVNQMAAAVQKRTR